MNNIETLSDKLRRIPPEKLRMQRIDQSLVEAKTQADGLTTKITFMTREAQAIEYQRGMKPRMHGIVLWIPLEELERLEAEDAAIKDKA